MSMSRVQRVSKYVHVDILILMPIELVIRIRIVKVNVIIVIVITTIIIGHVFTPFVGGPCTHWV